MSNVHTPLIVKAESGSAPLLADPAAHRFHYFVEEPAPLASPSCTKHVSTHVQRGKVKNILARAIEIHIIHRGLEKERGDMCHEQQNWKDFLNSQLLTVD